MRKSLIVLLAVLLGLWVCGALVAAPVEWKPDRTIVLIVPFAPGGSTDTTGRITAEYLSKELGVPVIVENIPGADTLIGWNELIRRPADGYTLGMSGSVANPWGLEVLAPEKPMWSADSFVALGSVTGIGASAGLVCKSGRWPDFMSFIEEVRANPGKIKFGMQGPGQATDAQFWEFEKLTGLDFNVVYYSGASDIQTDLLTGDLDAGRVSANRQEFVANENFTILALWGKEVPSDYPIQNLPFLADFDKELGFEYESTTYIQNDFLTLDVLARSETDPAILARIEKALENISKIPEFKEKILVVGWPYFADSATQTTAYRHLRDTLAAFRNSSGYEEWVKKVH